MQILGVHGGLWGVARGGAVVFANGEGVQKAVDVLHIRNVAAEANDDIAVEDAEALDVGETRERTVGSCKRVLVSPGAGAIARTCCAPRLSAAMTMPSLNLTPMTDVPVTEGD